MVTFEQARERVRAKFAPDWSAPGTYHVAAKGFESAQYFIVVQGAKECLVDGDSMFAILDDTVTLVNKASGAISGVSALSLIDSNVGFTPVG